MTTHHLKLTNTTDIPHYFRLLVSRPFSVSQDGASRAHRAPGAGWEQECEEGLAAGGRQLVLHPQENMLVSGGSWGPQLVGTLLWAESPSSLIHAHMCADNTPHTFVRRHKHTDLCIQTTRLTPQPMPWRAPRSALTLDTPLPANTGPLHRWLTHGGRTRHTSVNTTQVPGKQTLSVPLPAPRSRPSIPTSTSTLHTASPFPRALTQVSSQLDCHLPRSKVTVPLL